ncbi:MAG: hypothetical protein R3B72_51985 [Polyangiaceae bacterium]
MSARVPDFRIDIEGALVPAELRASVTSVNHSTSLEGADRVEVSLVNEGLRWLDHPLLALDNDLELWMGYAGELKRVFVGEISREANFPRAVSPSSPSAPRTDATAWRARPRTASSRSPSRASATIRSRTSAPPS